MHEPRTSHAQQPSAPRAAVCMPSPARPCACQHGRTHHISLRHTPCAAAACRTLMVTSMSPHSSITRCCASRKAMPLAPSRPLAHTRRNWPPTLSNGTHHTLMMARTPVAAVSGRSAAMHATAWHAAADHLPWRTSACACPWCSIVGHLWSGQVRSGGGPQLASPAWLHAWAPGSCRARCTAGTCLQRRATRVTPPCRSSSAARTPPPPRA